LIQGIVLIFCCATTGLEEEEFVCRKISGVIEKLACHNKPRAGVGKPGTRAELGT